VSLVSSHKFVHAGGATETQLLSPAWSYNLFYTHWGRVVLYPSFFLSLR